MTEHDLAIFALGFVAGGFWTVLFCAWMRRPAMTKRQPTCILCGTPMVTRTIPVPGLVICRVIDVCPFCYGTDAKGKQ